MQNTRHLFSACIVDTLFSTHQTTLNLIQHYWKNDIDNTFTSGVQRSSKLQVKQTFQSVILSVLFSKCFPLTESCTHRDLSILVSCFSKGDLSSLK